jgi:FkbM family methyltransferase
MVAYGHTIYWDSRHPSSHVLDWASESYEKDTTLLFQSLIRRGMTVVDLGAHIGYYSLLAGRQVGEKGKVYAFEPEPSNYALLQKNISANGYDDIIIALRKAVTSRPGVVQLFLGERDSGVTSMYAVPGNGRQTVIAEGTSLDDFFESEGWPQVHIIKIDIEGAEKMALEGMKQVVRRNQALKLIVEFNPAMQATAGVSNDEFFDTLTGLGFQKIRAICKGLRPITIPDDIRRVVKMTRGDNFINLLCEQARNECISGLYEQQR